MKQYDYVKIDHRAVDMDTSIIKRAIAYLKTTEGILNEKTEECHYVAKSFIAFLCRIK
jgi:hypothetical protein